jgi:hypothetical protein
VVLANTSNAPSSIYTNSTNPPVNQTNWTSWPSLPLHASVYSIPSREMTNARFISNSVPVVSFDFIIPK